MAVIIPNSAGYGDDHVDAPEWAQIIPYAGQRYGVIGLGSWAARPGAADREVRLSPGVGYGGGILDRTTADASLVLPASSSTVYHLIYCHRDWGNSRSTLTSKAGFATPRIPERDVTPGIVDDQPLWLARVDAGKSQVQELIDLRVWGGSGGTYALNGHALQYMTDLGTSLLIGKDLRADRLIDALGNPSWRLTDEVDRWERVSELGAGFEHYYGFGWNGLTVARRGQIVTGGGALIKDPNGVGATVLRGTPIARLPFEYLPKEKVATTSPEIEINDEGQLILTVDAPVGKSISCSFTFHRRNEIGI